MSDIFPFVFWSLLTLKTQPLAVGTSREFPSTFYFAPLQRMISLWVSLTLKNHLPGKFYSHSMKSVIVTSSSHDSWRASMRLRLTGSLGVDLSSSGYLQLALFGILGYGYWWPPRMIVCRVSLKLKSWGGRWNSNHGSRALTFIWWYPSVGFEGLGGCVSKIWGPEELKYVSKWYPPRKRRLEVLAFLFGTN